MSDRRQSSALNLGGTSENHRVRHAPSHLLRRARRGKDGGGAGRVRDRTVGYLDDRAGGHDGSGARGSLLLPHRVRVCGGLELRVASAHEGESIYVGHLEANGEGFHHTCVAYPSREAMREAKAELVRQGREMVQSADMGELGEFCYFDIPEMGALLELLYVTELPPPEKTIG
jgi:hypothetical protein